MSGYTTTGTVGRYATSGNVGGYTTGYTTDAVGGYAVNTGSHHVQQKVVA